MTETATLETETALAGVGLHTGLHCRAVFKPSRAGSAITFRRADVKGAAPVAALLGNVNSTVRGTNLSAGGSEVFTVEHILSACAGLGITDLAVELDGPEPPIMDGSARAFAAAFAAAGIVRTGGRIQTLSVDRALEYRAGDAVYTAKPAAEKVFRFIFEHPHPLVGRQEFVFEPARQDYAAVIAPARTFGFEEELAWLRQAGLAKGGSLENAVVVTGTEFLSAEGGLRFPDELARHKILDLLGDLALCGLPLAGVEITALRGGHRHNAGFGRLLLERGVRN
ncbi:MAG: UDP-3-O-acyl-N-acetylglucosamine deacetylase [Elusimicrobiaceae bacterium]|nr:UDP-3-O-acyl-N-acetylglucosamine deacetylase [Elusimicrobiaceae bacterium]